VLLAHAAADLAPSWLLVATLLLGIGLTWVWARASWPTPRLSPTAGHVLPAWTAPVLRVLAVALAAAGVAVWALTLTAGLFADTPNPIDNLALYIVNLQLLVLGILAAAVVGDWWAAAGPFGTFARLLPPRSAPGGAPPWTAPALLATFLWLVTCYHDDRNPVVLGAWLLGYTVAVLAGAHRWGRRWVATGEGLAVLFGAAAAIAPFRRDPATGRPVLQPPLSGLGGPLPPGTASVCVLTGSAAVFWVARRTDWWVSDINHGRTGWSETLVSTFGLVLTVGVAALVVMLGARRSTRPSPAGLVPLMVGVAGAMLLAQSLARGIDAIALISDPYGRGWDLLATADWHPDPRWEGSRRLAWTELALLLLGSVGAVLAAHDATLRTERGRASAEQAMLPQLAAGTVLAVAALYVLLP
jgi:hypothetical protein